MVGLETRPPLVKCFARLATFSKVARDMPSHLHTFNQRSEVLERFVILKYLVCILSFPTVKKPSQHLATRAENTKLSSYLLCAGISDSSFGPACVDVVLHQGRVWRQWSQQIPAQTFLVEILYWYDRNSHANMVTLDFFIPAARFAVTSTGVLVIPINLALILSLLSYESNHLTFGYLIWMFFFFFSFFSLL